MGNYRNCTKVVSVPSPDELFGLIRARTQEGKIVWTGTAYCRKGTVPGAGYNLSIELKHESDQRDGDWYTCTVKVADGVVSVGTHDQIKTLMNWINERPSVEALVKAKEILESL